VVILGLSELAGAEPLQEPHRVNTFHRITATGIVTVFVTGVGATTDHGGGFTIVGGGTGSSVGLVDGLIGTKLKRFIGTAGLLKVTQLLKS